MDDGLLQSTEPRKGLNFLNFAMYGTAAEEGIVFLLFHNFGL